MVVLETSLSSVPPEQKLVETLWLHPAVVRGRGLYEECLGCPSSTKTVVQDGTPKVVKTNNYTPYRK